jgi:hypothetical protein
MTGLARSLRARRGGTLLVAAVIIAAAGTAAAYWSATGSTTGRATTGAPALLELSPGTPADALFPGGLASVVLTVTNPNSAPTEIKSLALDTAEGVDGFDVDAGHAGCDLSALSFSSQSNGGLGWTVPPKAGAIDGSLVLTLTGAVSMDVGAADACQGATFGVFLVAGE